MYIYIYIYMYIHIYIHRFILILIYLYNVYQSNILALVGGSPSPPGFSETSIVLLDDDAGVRLWELQLYSPIVALCCSQGFLVAVMESKGVCVCVCLWVCHMWIDEEALNMVTSA